MIAKNISLDSRHQSLSLSTTFGLNWVLRAPEPDITAAQDSCRALGSEAETPIYICNSSIQWIAINYPHFKWYAFCVKNGLLFAGLLSPNGLAVSSEPLAIGRYLTANAALNANCYRILMIIVNKILVFIRKIRSTLQWKRGLDSLEWNDWYGLIGGRRVSNKFVSFIARKVFA